MRAGFALPQNLVALLSSHVAAGSWSHDCLSLSLAQETEGTVTVYIRPYTAPSRAVEINVWKQDFFFFFILVFGKASCDLGWLQTCKSGMTLNL